MYFSANMFSDDKNENNLKNYEIKFYPNIVFILELNKDFTGVYI